MLPWPLCLFAVIKLAWQGRSKGLLCSPSVCCEYLHWWSLCWSAGLELKVIFRTEAAPLICRSMEYLPIAQGSFSSEMLPIKETFCAQSDIWVQWVVLQLNGSDADLVNHHESLPISVCFKTVRIWSATVCVKYLLLTAVLLRVTSCGFLTFVVSCLAPERCKTSEFYSLSKITLSWKCACWWFVLKCYKTLKNPWNIFICLKKWSCEASETYIRKIRSSTEILWDKVRTWALTADIISHL